VGDKHMRTGSFKNYDPEYRNNIVYQTVMMLGGVDDAAKILGTTGQNLRNWMTKKEFPERMLLIVEEKTGGKVRREMLRPELFVGFARIRA